jgi:hypothetical protein
MAPHDNLKDEENQACTVCRKSIATVFRDEKGVIFLIPFLQYINKPGPQQLNAKRFICWPSYSSVNKKNV